MKRFFGLLVVAAAMGCDATRSVVPDESSSPNAAAALGQRGFAQEVVIDFAGPPTNAHAGPGPHPTTESDRFTLLSGIRWFSGATIEYRIVGSQPVSGANTAVVAGEEAWDALVSARTFTRNDNTTQINPCTDLPNSVTWVAIDGPGGVLGGASPCYFVNTKEIVGFEIILDSGDSWGTNGAATVIDVANVATHEFGHVVGLGHVGAPRDGCLTMFKATTDGEIQKRTLGWGDKLGLAFLYGNTNTTPGTCGS